MEPILNIALTAARQAGDIITRSLYRLDTVTVSIKKERNDFVSEVDIKAEQAIINTLEKSYPTYNFIAEESGNIDNDSECTWIIDPLDGTNNYLHGFPHFCISIALQINQHIEYGLIYDPIRDEVFTASRGRGAHMNNKRLRVSKQHALEHALIGTGFPLRTEAVFEPYFATLHTLYQHCLGVRRAGSAALDLAYVAAARLEGSWHYGLNIWDIAAGSLLIREAGGLITDFNGDEQYLTQGNIITGNPKILKQLLPKIQSNFKSLLT
ncbi:MAG: inositol monophosphatase [Legionellales bacterium]|nr:inositol monophosphatase [Legionellales bacterium]